MNIKKDIISGEVIMISAYTNRRTKFNNKVVQIREMGGFEWALNLSEAKWDTGLIDKFEAEVSEGDAIEVEVEIRSYINVKAVIAYYIKSWQALPKLSETATIK